MAFGAAASEHPVAAHAVGEVTGQILEALADERPDLALLFATGHHAAALPAAVAAVARVLGPATLLAAAGPAALANGREIEEGGAIVLWAGRFGPVHRFETGRGRRAADPPFLPSALVLMATAGGGVAERALVEVSARWPGLPVVGAIAGRDRRGGGAVLVDGTPVTAGAVGAFVGPGVAVDVVVSQGARAIGHAFTVTAADGEIVRELGGRPALDRLLELIDADVDDDAASAIPGGAVHVGRLVDERTTDPARSDFLVGAIAAVSRREGWIALHQPVSLGDTVQFHLVDADAADDDLRAALSGATADAVLAFPSTDRGRRLFDTPHHDATVVADYLGRPPSAGLFSERQCVPVGGANFLHPSAIALALLRQTGRPARPIGSVR